MQNMDHYGNIFSPLIPVAPIESMPCRSCIALRLKMIGSSNWKRNGKNTKDLRYLRISYRPLAKNLQIHQPKKRPYAAAPFPLRPYLLTGFEWISALKIGLSKIPKFGWFLIVRQSSKRTSSRWRCWIRLLAQENMQRCSKPSLGWQNGSST